MVEIIKIITPAHPSAIKVSSPGPGPSAIKTVINKGVPGSLSPEETAALQEVTDPLDFTLNYLSARN